MSYSYSANLNILNILNFALIYCCQNLKLSVNDAAVLGTNKRP